MVSNGVYLSSESVQNIPVHIKFCTTSEYLPQTSANKTIPERKNSQYITLSVL